MSSASTPASPARDLRSNRSTAYRICIHALVPLRRDVRTRRVAAALTDAGFDVTVVDVAHDGVEAGAAERADDGLAVRHIRVPAWLAEHYSPTHPALWLLFKIVRLMKAFSAVAGTPADAYHAADLMALPSCYIAARLRRKPLVFESYEMPLTQPHLKRFRLLHGLVTCLLRLMIARCTAVIVVSPPIGDELRRQFGGPACVVLRNIPSYQEPVTSARLRDALALDAGTRIALYQGGIQENRSLDILVRAARHLPADCVIVMMGDGPSRAQLARLIESERVGDCVKMIGAVPYDELLAWTASADIGLTLFSPDFSPSIRMCLPNKLFEYLMAGLPVLTSRLEAVEAIVEAYDVGRVVDALDAETVAASITNMLADAADLQKWHRNALAAAKSDLNWEHEQERLVRLYNEIQTHADIAPRAITRHVSAR